MPGPRSTARTPRPSRSGKAVTVWSPFDAPKPQTFPLETFAAHGVEATVTMRAFTARESMAFRDRVTTEMLATDVSNDPTVLLGVMESRLVTAVVQSWSGFPSTVTRELTELERRRAPRGSRVEGLVTEETDLTRLEHLSEIGDADVYNELVRLARRVEPDPMGRGGTRSLEGTRNDDVDDDDDEQDDDGEDVEDVYADDDEDDASLDDDLDDGEGPLDPPVRATRSRAPSTRPGGRAARPVEIVKGEVVPPATSRAASPAPRRTSRQAAR